MEDKLLESVKNKSYFNKGVEWYCYRYLFCITERSWLALVVSFLSVCVFLLLLDIYLLFPTERDLNFVKYINHRDDEFSVIRKLSFYKKENEHISVARYLIQKYVELYESRGVAKFPYQTSFIKNNSTHRVYKNFQEKIKNEVSDSPTHKKKVIKTSVMRLSIDQSTVDLVKFAGSATVIFTTEQDKEIQNQIIKIDFTLSNIRTTMRSITPFKFVVNDYKVK